MTRNTTQVEQLLFKFPDYVALSRERFQKDSTPWRHFYAHCFAKLSSMGLDKTIHSVLSENLKLHNASLHKITDASVYVLFESGKALTWFNLKWSNAHRNM